ncbi:MAG: extracellular solute-binding protein [Chloroflexota bacterium]
MQSQSTRISRRRALALFGGTLAAAGLAACAPAQAPDQSTPAPTTKATQASPAASTGAAATMLMWTPLAGKSLEVLTNLLGEFKKASNITVEATSVGTGEIEAKFLASHAAGSPPDIYYCGSRVMPEVALGGALAVLDNVVKFPADYMKAFDQTTILEGKRYGVGVSGGLGCMAYNGALLEQVGWDPKKPPANWEELVSLGEKVTKSGPGRSGVLFANQPVGATAQSIIFSLLLAAGGELLTSDGKAPAFNTEAGLAVFQFGADLVQKYKVMPTKTYGMIDTLNDFGTGNAGAIQFFPAWIAGMKAFKFTSVAAAMPKNKKSGTQFAGAYWTLAAKSQKKEQFGQLIDWWLKPENNSRWCMQVGGTPATEGVLKSTTYQNFLKSEPLVQPFIDSIPFAVANPGVIGTGAVMQALAEAWEACLLGKLTPKAALDQAEKQGGAELKKAQASFKP